MLRGRQMILELSGCVELELLCSQLRNTKQRLPPPAHWGDSLPQSAVGIELSQHVCECVATVVFLSVCVCGVQQAK